VDQQLALDNRIQRETVIPPEVFDWLMMADARLTQCNLIIQCSESAQKAANGKKPTQPGHTGTCLLRNRNP
jgi:hypothetical protein